MTSKPFPLSKYYIQTNFCGVNMRLVVFAADPQAAICKYCDMQSFARPKTCKPYHIHHHVEYESADFAKDSVWVKLGILPG